MTLGPVRQCHPPAQTVVSKRAADTTCALSRRSYLNFLELKETNRGSLDFHLTSCSLYTSVGLTDQTNMAAKVALIM